MKRALLSALIAVLSMGMVAAPALAGQVGQRSAQADLDGDGTTTIHEVVLYNRDFRAK